MLFEDAGTTPGPRPFASEVRDLVKAGRRQCGRCAPAGKRLGQGRARLGRPVRRAIALDATSMRIVCRMGRRKRPALAPWLFGPPGVCDACGCPCGTMDQAGIVCYACNAGVFMPRGFWQFASCPACAGTDAFCLSCGGRNWVATPREDIDVGELEAYWQKVIRREHQNGPSLPEPIAKLGRS
ncbi:hypothetical protein LMG31884_47210 (plasmid) [Xanthomonas hydrangeae]|nr:hypothetical protein LMG31884_47210 [Xanthomonas hydrangeae]CAD7741047.1 hypothetical protein LMG31884_47210 [Xanthomonas hydrangeae]CAD7747978.1 hypothetical protein LMG31887_46600 [Xanthomonas hydrangeae]CAD7747979.1 hypothetical protein LMG31887_46600 [Xanthomonas hydrangeae]CAD7748144.1 hypothetical protein LMG31885_44890 [Xanthomonas hydrangeae]